MSGLYIAMYYQELAMHHRKLLPAWACEKVASDLELGGGFRRYSDFLHYLQLASHELATIGINVTKNEIQIPEITYHTWRCCSVRKACWDR